MLRKAAGSGSLVWTANRQDPDGKIHLKQVAAVRDSGGRQLLTWKMKAWQKQPRDLRLLWCITRGRKKARSHIFIAIFSSEFSMNYLEPSIAL